MAHLYEQINSIHLRPMKNTCASVNILDKKKNRVGI